MNSSAVVLTSTLSGTNIVTISVDGNPSQQITIDLNTASVNGFTQAINLNQLGALEGSTLNMSVTTNGVVNNVYLPFQWTYSSTGGAQILKLDQTSSGTYTAYLFSDSYNSVICTNESYGVVSFSFTDLSPNSTGAVIYRTKNLSQNQSETVSASQIGNLKVVQIEAKSLSAPSVAYEPILISYSSSAVKNFAFTGSSTDSQSATSTLTINSISQPYPASNTDTTSSNATNALTSNNFNSLSPAYQIAVTPNSTVAGVVQNISNIDTLKTSDSPSSNYATNTSALSALVSSTPTAPIQSSNTAVTSSSTLTSSIIKPSDSSVVFASNINNLAATAPVTMTRRSSAFDTFASLGLNLASLVGNNPGNVVGQGGSLLDTSSTSNAINSAANTALALGGSNPYVTVGASLAKLIGGFF